MNLRLFSFSLLFTITHQLAAQKIERIFVKKDKKQFYFFPKYTFSDTIIPTKTDVFYLVLSDSLKMNSIVQTQNAQLQKGNNDSVVVLKYLQGINYIHKYIANADEVIDTSKIRKNKLILDFTAMIDGPSALPQNKIKISFVDKFSGKTYAEFVYNVTSNN